MRRKIEVDASKTWVRDDGSWLLFLTGRDKDPHVRLFAVDNGEGGRHCHFSVEEERRAIDLDYGRVPADGGPRGVLEYLAREYNALGTDVEVVVKDGGGRKNNKEKKQ